MALEVEVWRVAVAVVAGEEPNMLYYLLQETVVVGWDGGGD